MFVRTLPSAVMIAAVVALFGCSRGGPDTPLVRAVLLLSEEKLPEALVQCDQALSADPTNCQAWCLRGEINQRAGNFEEALVDYSRAIELDPENSDGHYYRSALLELQGKAKPENRRHENDIEPVSLLTSHDSHDSRNVEDSIRFVDYGWYPEDDVDSYEFRYGQADHPPKLGAYHEEARPKRAPVDTPYRRWLKSKAERPAREVYSPLAMPLDDYDQQEGILSPPSPRQLTRYGYQWGDRVAGHVQRPPSTTGRRSRVEQITPQTRCGLFIGQRVPPRELRRSSRLRPVSGFIYARRTREDRDYSPRTFSCSDGIDNNGDGRVDQFDPTCWLDGAHPATYSPVISEVGISPVIAPLPASTPLQAMQ